MKNFLLSLLLLVPFILNAQVSDPEYTATYTYTEFPRNNWTSMGSSVNSEGVYSKAIDSTASTFWTTAWTPKEKNKWYVVDMKTSNPVKGVYIQQRQGNNAGPRVVWMRVLTSQGADSSHWDTAGIYQPSSSNLNKQFFAFSSIKTCQYIKFDSLQVPALSGSDGTTCLAEVGALSSIDSTKTITDNYSWNPRNWAITATSTQSNDGGAIPALTDRTASTFWSSQWSPVVNAPHTISVDMGKINQVNSIWYRQRLLTASNNGAWIYNGYVTYANNSDYSDSVHVAVDSFVQSSDDRYFVSFPAASFRYFRLVVTKTRAAAYTDKGNGSATPGTSDYESTSLAEIGAYYMTTLPVSIGSISASKSLNSVLVKWSTFSETNSSRFDILRSGDGNTFGIIGTITAAGNSSSALSYQFEDKNPQSGVNYYKIVETAFDGRTTTSDVVNVAYNVGSATFAIKPNPVASDAIVTLPLSATSTVIRVYNISGVPVTSKTVAAGTTTTTLSLGSLPAGVYFVKYGTQTVKIIKK